MRNRSLTILNNALLGATLLRALLFAILLWGAIDASNVLLRLLMSLLASITLVNTVNIYRYTKKILTRLDKLDINTN